LQLFFLNRKLLIAHFSIFNISKLANVNFDIFGTSVTGELFSAKVYEPTSINAKDKNKFFIMLKLCFNPLAERRPPR